MAGETDGIVGMVSGSGEEQPMDLSRATKKSTRLMPPLIPISQLPSGYHGRKLAKKRFSAIPEHTIVTREDAEERVPNEAEPCSKEEWSDGGMSRKRFRLAGEDGWEGPPRLDRARSVPQLNPLPSLQRHKSLSESRISVATTEVEAKVSPSVSLSDEELRQRLQCADSEQFFNNSWIYFGYYSQMFQHFQAQELLRRFALQHQDNKVDVVPSSTTAKPQNPVEDACDLRRRQARPLTGKHVRPGTGASPATLLTLRRKIQARQQRSEGQQLPE